MSSPVPEGQPSMWPVIRSFLTPPAAASMAVVPVFYGFVRKSCLQLECPIPSYVIKEALLDGTKAGLIVGTQMVVQDLTEKAIKHLCSEERQTFNTMLASSVIVGLVSSPFLAVFNGWSMKQPAKQTLTHLSKWQVSAIVARETSFLFSMRISDPISETMKEQFGDSSMVEYSSQFASGAIGSLIGHSADTALTRWQRDMKILSARQLMNGGATKAITVGLFAIIYNASKKALEAK